MACAWPPRLQLLHEGLLAALLAMNIGAVRLGGGAVSSGGSSTRLASKAPVPLAAESAAVWAQRDRDLRAAATYIDSIGIQKDLHLGNVKDILERFEDIKARLTFFGIARDSLHRLPVRKILKDIKEQGKTLRTLAGKLEAEGEADDGGDELPTQRDNICSRISSYRVELDFVAMVQGLCEYLDAVRGAVDAGEDEESMAYSVSGWLSTIAAHPDYSKGRIDWEIDQVLGEERRWVAKHIAPRPARRGNISSSSEGTTRRFRKWPLRAWETQIWADVDEDTAASLLKALKLAQDDLLRATVEDDLLLSSVRIRIHRLDACKMELTQFISSSGPASREWIRERLQEIKARMDALRALAERKLAAGEADRSDELPSQRDNICSKLESFNLEEDFQEDVRKICQAFDRMHVNARLESQNDKGIPEILGRMVAVRQRPGYSDTHVAGELEDLLVEEFSWIEQQEAAVRV